MTQEEWIIEVDSEDQIVGKIDRTQAHDGANPRLHREVMTLLYTAPSHLEFLLQHRSMKKMQLPGLWTLSVTGHVDFADISVADPDGYMTAAKRESEEEIGVEVNNLKLMGKVEQKIQENWSMMGIVTGEYEGELKLDPEEVSEVKIFNKNTVVEVSDKLTPGAKKCLIYLGLFNE